MPPGRAGFATIFAGGLMLTLALADVLRATAATPEQVIADRRAGYKHMGENFKAMKAAVDTGADVRPLAPRAAEVVAWAQRIPTMFPPGTETGGGTHARPEIWSRRPGFDALAAELLRQAEKLEAVARSGDKPAFAAQFKATGAVCGKCHQTYRYKIS